MLAGLPQDALSQYLIAGEHLRAANDVLWLAGSLEGQCAASLVLDREEERGINSLILPTECAANSTNLTLNGLGNDVDESKFRNPPPLSKEEIVERLSEALKLYSRVSNIFNDCNEFCESYIGIESTLISISCSTFGFIKSFYKANFFR